MLPSRPAAGLRLADAELPSVGDRLAAETSRCARAWRRVACATRTWVLAACERSISETRIGSSKRRHHWASDVGVVVAEPLPDHAAGMGAIAEGGDDGMRDAQPDKAIAATTTTDRTNQRERPPKPGAGSINSDTGVGR